MEQYDNILKQNNQFYVHAVYFKQCACALFRQLHVIIWYTVQSFWSYCSVVVTYLKKLDCFAPCPFPYLKNLLQSTWNTKY